MCALHDPQKRWKVAPVAKTTGHVEIMSMFSMTLMLEDLFGEAKGCQLFALSRCRYVVFLEESNISSE